MRSRAPKGKTKPAARPLAKRAYAYVDRLRGASKYLDADDNARLVEEASIDGFLLKQVRRSVVGLPGVSRPTKFHLEWCELKARTLYYTRRDPKSGDSIGFTKKLRWARGPTRLGLRKTKLPFGL